MSDYVETGVTPQFKSAHWEETNVISHLRMNERTYKGKKVAFMEELQSDWAREGRSKGFTDDISVRKAALEKEAVAINREAASRGEGANVTDLENRLGAIRDEQRAWVGKGNGQIPNNPLLKN